MTSNKLYIISKYVLTKTLMAICNVFNLEEILFNSLKGISQLESHVYVCIV